MEESKWAAVMQALAASILIVALGTLVPLMGLLLIPVVAVRTAVGAIASPLRRSPPRLLGN